MDKKELIWYVEFKRKALNYTKDYLTAQAKISPQAYSKVLQNGGDLKLSTMIKLLKVVGYVLLPIEENVLKSKN